jgi:hypothetical protein
MGYSKLQSSGFMLKRQKYEFLRSELKKARLESASLTLDLAKNLEASAVNGANSGFRSFSLPCSVLVCGGTPLGPCSDPIA